MREGIRPLTALKQIEFWDQKITNLALNNECETGQQKVAKAVQNG
jgi:hypothetical protein